jgi:UAA transporter family
VWLEMNLNNKDEFGLSTKAIPILWSRIFLSCVTWDNRTRILFVKLSSCLQMHVTDLFCTGVCVLLMAFCSSALMGIYQELIFSQYGKHAQEALFYNVSSL